MTGLFIEKDRFGKFEWTVRSKNIESTPHTRHVNSTRAATSVPFHAGHWMDRDQVNQTRYSIQPKVQMELANSLGRNIDKLIYTSMYQPVLQYASAASASFAGLPTASTVNLPNASKVVLGNSAALSIIRFTEYAVDELVKDFEDDNWDAREICVIMTPAVRRQLKKFKASEMLKITNHFTEVKMPMLLDGMMSHGFIYLMILLLL